MDWTVEQRPGFATRVKVDLQKEFWVLLRSDAHWDNPDSNRKLMDNWSNGGTLETGTQTEIVAKTVSGNVGFA